MKNTSNYDWHIEGYTVKMLEPEDAPILQKLYEACFDIFILTEGVFPEPTAAKDEFEALPEGKTKNDKFIWGLFDKNDVLMGMIESIRSYPDDETWWLGLMMLNPNYRGKKLGISFYKAFEKWIVSQNFNTISLVVIATNIVGLSFWKKVGFDIIEKTEPKTFGKKMHEMYKMIQILK
jgi:GNAT superfamily N-acetyltransferase